MAGVLLGGKPGTGYQDQCYRCIFQEIDPELSGGAFAKPPVELTDSSDGLFFIFRSTSSEIASVFLVRANSFLASGSVSSDWKNAVFSTVDISPEKYLSNLSFMAYLFVSIIKTKASEVTTKGK